MDSRKLNSLIKKTFDKDFRHRNITPKGSTYIYNDIGWLIKGFSFERHYYNLYVTWFFMPLIPNKDAFYFTYGERLKTEKGADIFKLKDDSLDKELEKLIPNMFSLLDAINDIHDFYRYFYEEDNLSKLSLHSTTSSLRLIETDIYCRAYMNLDFASEYERFVKEWESSDRKHLDWMQDIKKHIDLLIVALEKGEIENYLIQHRSRTIETLKVEKFLKKEIFIQEV